jgi:hypothetical protein
MKAESILTALTHSYDENGYPLYSLARVFYIRKII